ncbi:hypothetical protein [Streptomyces mirabilis]
MVAVELEIDGPFWCRLLVGHVPLGSSESARHVCHVLDGLRVGQ